MSLSNEYSGMMNWLGKSQLEDLGLKTALQEILNLKTENVIKFHAALIQYTNTYKATQQSITYKLQSAF